MQYVIIIILSTLFGCGNAGEDSIYILPSNFQGVVFILYNQENGEPIKYENGSRLYNIPSTGILKTQFTPNLGWRSMDKFYYIENDQRIALEKVDNSNLIIGDAIKVCCYSSGKSGHGPNNLSEYVEFAMFYVSNEKNLDSIYKLGEKINPINLVTKE